MEGQLSSKEKEIKSISLLLLNLNELKRSGYYLDGYSYSDAYKEIEKSFEQIKKKV